MTIKDDVPTKYAEPEINLSEPEPEIVYGVGSPSDPPIVNAVPVSGDPSYNPAFVPNALQMNQTVAGSAGNRPQPPPYSQKPATTTTTTTYTVPPPAYTQSTATVPPANTQQAPARLFNLGRNPKTVTCPYCRESMRTATRFNIDAFPIIMAVVICLLFWPLTWIPFVSPCCKTTEHRCSKCGRTVGQTGPCQD